MSVRAPEVANKILLDEKEMPTRWYNIQADLPFPGSPPLHPGTRQPIGPQDLAPLFPMELIKQEVSQERYIDIPDPVQEALRLWRPTPLMRATRLERELKTTAKIYYKYEGVSPPGSHKLSNRAATLTPSPKMSPFSPMMSPTLMPMRNVSRFSTATAPFRDAKPC